MKILLTQDEFRRLYTQLEQLKIKNMRLSNPHVRRHSKDCVLDSHSTTTMLTVDLSEDSSHYSPDIRNGGKKVSINLDVRDAVTSL